ncbi:translational activator of cytochrome c oxidase 1 [Trichonephila clavipes]|nr:translational activator of cytochrome c oxidase 1 [Trichonephila clavipes]
MAIAQQTDMDFTPQSPLSTASSGTAPTPCEELTAMKTYIRRLQIICNEKEKTVSLLRLDHGHIESDTLYQLAWNEFQDVQSTLQQAVSDFDSLPPCTNPGCSHHISPKNTPNTTPPPSPTRRNTQLKRKDDEDFEFPPLRKTARKTILEKSEDINLENQYSFLPNVIIKQVTGQLAPSTATLNMPTVNTNENLNQGKNALPPIMMRITKTAVKQTLKSLGYYFYVITPKNERPIKIVIKGFPKTADPEDIKADLEEEGFQPDKVTQLVRRRTKQKLPVFLVTLPRSIENLKIFDLKTLAHLNITVDGYNGKGITQCFTCQNFHHNSDNCFLKPRCLKCGEEHVTKDCPIKQRLDTKFCINCQVYGQMANWHGCPCFPKPPKGAAKTNRNTYTNLYNSFVRPNFSYAQVTNNTPRNNVQNKQQMAPRRHETSRQTEAVNIVPPIQNQAQIVPPIINSNPTPNVNLNLPNGNNNDIKALLNTTVQCLIQLLNAMNTAPTLANNFDTVNSAQADTNHMYSLIEASFNVNNDKNDRPTSSDNNRAFGGTLILVKNAINHYSLPTPPMQAIEATIVILTLLLITIQYRFPDPSASNKEISDQALICFKYLRLTKKAIREFGPIVEENKRLEYLLQKAKEYNIPPDYIDFVCRLSVDSRATVGLMDLLLFHNCHFIVQYEDIDISLTKHHLLKLCDTTE